MRLEIYAAAGAVMVFISSLFNPGLFGADSTTVIELDKMVVRTQRSNIMSSDIIDSTELSRAYDSKTAEGLLVNLAGIDVQRTSPAAGKGIGVSIRGLDESRSLIMLNGRPLNGAGVMGGDYVDWSLLPIADITEIEVIRGVKSAEYGNTVGGVINIITRRDMQKPTGTTINASYGIVSPEHAKDAFENRSTGLSLVHHANILNRAALDLFAGYAKGEPFLRNNYYNRASFGGEFSVLLPLEIRASAGFHNTIHTRGFAIVNEKDSPYYDSDYPEASESPKTGGGGPSLAWKGGDYYFGDRSYWKNIRTQIDFSLQKTFPNLVLTGLVHINDQDRTEYFYAITDTNKLVLERFSKPEDHTWGWNITAKQTLGESQILKYGFEGSSLRYSNTDIRQCETEYFSPWNVPTEYGDPDSTIRAADRYGAFIQSFLTLGKRFELTPGIRYDYYIGAERDTGFDESNFHGVSPNCGIGVKTWKSGEVSLQGAYAYRFPTCPELYWYYGGYSPSDRKKFSPERAAQAELAVSQTLSVAEKLNGVVDVRGYYYHVKDYMRTIFGYKPSRLVYNIDKVTFAGFECACSFDITQYFGIRANYTFQHTEKSGDTYDSSMVFTKGLPELPKHKANAGFEYHAPNGATVGFGMRFVGEREIIVGNPAMSNAVTLEHLDAFTAFRLYGSYPVLLKEKYSAKINLGVDNLFNAGYEEEPGIPMPGITTTGSVEVTF